MTIFKTVIAYKLEDKTSEILSAKIVTLSFQKHWNSDAEQQQNLYKAFSIKNRQTDLWKI